MTAPKRTRKPSPAPATRAELNIKGTAREVVTAVERMGAAAALTSSAISAVSPSIVSGVLVMMTFMTHRQGAARRSAHRRRAPLETRLT